MAEFFFSAFADEAGDTLDDQIQALRENGIRYMEPRNIGGKVVLDLADHDLKDVRHRLDDAGITVGSLGSPIGKYPIEEDFAPHFDRLRRALDCAALLGTNRMRVFSFFVKQQELAQRRDEVMNRMSRMLTEAKKYAITLCHENEAHIYGEQPAQVRDLLSSLPELYGIHDPANYVLAGAKAAQGLDATLIRFSYMHVKDAEYTEKLILPAGEGEGAIAQSLNRVSQTVNTPVMLTLEPHLAIFNSFKNIRADGIHGRYQFANGRVAFDFAVRALEGVLTADGYRKEGFTWKK